MRGESGDIETNDRISRIKSRTPSTPPPPVFSMFASLVFPGFISPHPHLSHPTAPHPSLSTPTCSSPPLRFSPHLLCSTPLPSLHASALPLSLRPPPHLHHPVPPRHALLRATANEVVSPEVVSPFQEGEAAKLTKGPLELTVENVELVLDEMRPYLQADGGNVAVRGIENDVVQLELQGACGSCPSSTVTMKMGLERGLREKIPSIKQVVQVASEGPSLTEEGVDAVLEEIRPFLKMAGGTVDLISLDAESVQPTAHLSITGSGATINSVRVEIAQRLKRNFPTLANVTWE